MTAWNAKATASVSLQVHAVIQHADDDRAMEALAGIQKLLKEKIHNFLSSVLITQDGVFQFKLTEIEISDRVVTAREGEALGGGPILLEPAEFDRVLQRLTDDTP